MKSEKNYIYRVVLYDDYSLLPLKLNEEVDSSYENEVRLGLLSKKEKEVYLLVKDNCSIKEISEKMNVDVKSVYNCLYRIKKKT